jgi:hypothetical protein
MSVVNSHWCEVNLESKIIILKIDWAHIWPCDNLETAVTQEHV